MQSIINMFRKYGITMYHIEMQSDSHVCIQNIATSNVTKHTIEPMIDVAVTLSEEEKTAIENFIDVDEVAKWLLLHASQRAKSGTAKIWEQQLEHSANVSIMFQRVCDAVKEQNSAMVRAYLFQKNLLN